MKCTSCGGRADIELRRHNAAFCSEHFLLYVENQVKRAVHDHDMIKPTDHVLVAVSGGKDSLALWDVLVRLGYWTEGLYIDLGIAGYSLASKEKAQAFAAQVGTSLRVVSLPELQGMGIPELARKTRRVACSVCGLNKRYLFNWVARTSSFDVVVTGHNLDDEAATLLGNVLHWQVGYLARQSPVMPAVAPGLVKKAKPLFRLTERETAAYCVMRGIDYIVDECPNATGARSLAYKDVLNRLERESPGTKQQFLGLFLEQARTLFTEDSVSLRTCANCGEPTTADICAYCRMMQRADLEPLPLIDLQ